jgi:hypothetical protein
MRFGFWREWRGERLMHDFYGVIRDGNEMGDSGGFLLT